MSALSTNDKGHLVIAGKDAVELAERYGTPLYVYDLDQIRDNIRGFQAAFDNHPVPRRIDSSSSSSSSAQGLHHDLAPPVYQVAYASKALSIVAIYEVVKDERNVAVDVVSGGELYTALCAGVDPHRIHFHGNNKSEEEIRYALESGIGCFVVDSFHEIALLQRLTHALFDGEKQAEPPRRVNALLRVSPGVTAHTHEYISTGQVDSKFGFDVNSGQAQEALRRVVEQVGGSSSDENGGSNGEVKTWKCNYLHVLGLHCHIGSQIFSTEGYVLATRRILALAEEWGLLARDGPSPAGVPARDRFVLNIGGGFGIAYTAEDTPLAASTFVSTVLDTITDYLTARLQAAAPQPAGAFLFPEVWIEPGRSIVGAAGTTLYTVGARKTIPALRRHFVTVDGGMSDNIRPVLYQARYAGCIANRMAEHARFAALSAAQQAAELASADAAEEAQATIPPQQTKDSSSNANYGTTGTSTGMVNCTVVGKLCETGDQLIKDVPLPQATRPGDILAVHCTGAYGYSMASNYNRMRRPAVLFVERGNGGKECVVVRRETCEDLVKNDVSYLASGVG